MSEYALVFVTGLLTSLHCVGMCGPIVLAYSIHGSAAGGGSGAPGLLALHAAYNAGRVISYGAIGAVVGLAGQALYSLQAVGEYVAISGGMLMCVAGLAILGIIPVHRIISSRGSAGISGRIHAGFVRSKSIRSKLLLGILTPLIPCGILYAMFLKAATAGGALGGALTMALFGLGMTPALILVGSFSSFASSRLRKGAEQLAAVLIIIMGVSLLVRGFHVPYLHWLWAPMHGTHGHGY